MASIAELNRKWGLLLVNECIQNGINTFCISPGSRNTPLVLAVADAVESGHAQALVHYDERGAAFYALGWAKALQRPVVLVCTSGTAAANYFPAIIEASQDCVPLIVLTADRPPELLDTGANQSIDQIKIYGDYVRWQFTLPCPDEKIPVSMIRTTVDQAVYRSMRAPAGPVHIDCMFREPLYDPHNHVELARMPDVFMAKPCTVYAPCQPDYAPAKETLGAIIQKAKHGVFIIGALYSETERSAVCDVAQSLNWPVMADITSGLRMGNRCAPFIAHYNQLLLHPRFRDQFNPDTIIHVGGAVTSKLLMEYLREKTPRQYVRIARHPLRDDPLHSVTLHIELDIAQLDRIMPENNTVADITWCQAIYDLDQKADSLLDQCLDTIPFAEPHLARQLSSLMTDESALFLGNSMPIRAMDMFACPSGASVPVGANRGASGIDGIVATAAGYACGLNRRTTLLIGDLSLLHDLNSLPLAVRNQPPLIIVVINNHGGGIFHYLPVAQATHNLDKYFVASHDMTFEHAAAMCSLHYTNVRKQTEFMAAYNTVLELNRSSIIEVTIAHEANVAAYNAVKRKINEMLY